MNYSQLDLYLVAEGVVAPADEDTEWDGVDSVLVAATSEAAALAIAESYGRNEVEPGNLMWLGKTISVVTLRDDEGNYA